MKIYLCGTGRIVFFTTILKAIFAKIVEKILSNVIYTGIQLIFVGYKYATFYF